MPPQPIDRFYLLYSDSLSELPVLQFQDVILSTLECRVFVRGQEVRLQPQEFRLLKFLMTYPQQVWSRSQLLTQVWGANFSGKMQTVDVHIRKLREKLELDSKHPEYIVTVRGSGYRFGWCRLDGLKTSKGF